MAKSKNTIINNRNNFNPPPQEAKSPTAASREYANICEKQDDDLKSHIMKMINKVF